ncbi:MAG: hypothetical protein EA370_12335 [Wenzhouxiangella sp.]|nr:MAG: hypothetical protein EA370_12335 [Wenzhouxiangella sp.]
MKILAIRGRNLASLAGDFEIDFQAEPLASAGVFAITGPTGAGKSTLLDALALALFHDTPRLRNARESGVFIPDAGDSAISPQDPRNILRRGTGEGFAEVDYVGIDGDRWRARWEVRRARGKAEGRLQFATASLENLDKEQQQGGKIKETRETIERTTGLSYDQFCRSILLAQNEFAAFLRADGGQRADLLEALTGTEIYRLISKLCHQRNKEEADRVKELEKELGMDPPLNETARTELEQGLAQAAAAEAEARTEHECLHKEANWHGEGSKLQDRRGKLDTELQTLDRQLQERKADMEKVRQMEAIGPARTLYRDFEQAGARLAAHDKRQDAVNTEYEKSRSEADTSSKRLDDAGQALNQAETRQREQAEPIRKARELDQVIAGLIGRQAERQAESKKLADSITETARKLKQDQAALAATEKTLAAWPAWQQAHPGLAGAKAHWTQAGQALNEAMNALEKREQASAEAKRAGNDAREARARLEKLQAGLEQAKEAVRLGRQQRDQAARREQAIDSEAIDRDQARLLARESGLERLGNQVDAEQEARTRLERARQDHGDAATGHARHRQRLQELDQALPIARERSEQARKAWQASRNIADQHTEALRQQLVDGEPCPVCGSRDHPGHDQGNDEIARIVTELKDQLKQAEDDATALERERASIEAGATQAAANLERLKDEIETLTQRHQAACTAIGQTTADLEIEFKSPTELPASLEKLTAELQSSHTELRQRKDEFDQARKALGQAQKVLGKAEVALETSEAQLNAASKEAKPLIQAEQNASSQLELRTREWNAAAETAGKTLGLEAHPDESAIRDLLNLWQQGEPLRQAAAEAEQQHPLLQERLGERRQQSDQLKAGLDKLTEELAKLDADIQSRREERSAVLEDSDPDNFERTLQQATDQARKAREEAVTANQVAQNAKVAAKSALEHWAMDRTACIAAVDQARAKLTDWLARHQDNEHLGLAAGDLEGLMKLLAVPDTQWQPLRAELDTLHAGILDARSRLKENTEQLAAWKAEKGSDRDAEAVAAALEAATTALKTTTDHRAGLQFELRADDQRRQRATGQLEKIRAQQAISEQWQKLDDLIGSAEGTRFQRYAQQFTLDVLITHANAQLNKLAPRYRLQRGESNLNILVVDDDMGGELRGVHSLSGGETFLASLALALGLAELSSQRIKLESLFIDEGFGSLDADTLRVAMDALDRLQAQGRKVGVISHVQEMSDRIGVQIQVERTAPGCSELRVTG